MKANRNIEMLVSRRVRNFQQKKKTKTTQTNERKATKKSSKIESKILFISVYHLLILGAADFSMSQSVVRYFSEGLPHLAQDSHHYWCNVCYPCQMSLSISSRERQELSWLAVRSPCQQI